MTEDPVDRFVRETIARERRAECRRTIRRLIIDAGIDSDGTRALGVEISEDVAEIAAALKADEEARARLRRLAK